MQRKFAVALIAGTALVTALGTAVPAVAETENRVTLKDQTSVALTIYNRNMALIKEQRTVTLKKGRNLIAFIDVSGRMRPETAILRATTPGRINLIEQNFNFDIMSRRKLLEKSVGQFVRIIKVHPTTGVETILKAKVLSASKGIVLQIGDRIETGFPGRIVFDRIPPNMRARPTLVVELEAERAGPVTLDLSYLSRGLRWRADYVGELNATENRLHLNGWVTLINRSGTTYRNANLQLVAGDLNVVRRGLEARMSRRSGRGSASRRPQFRRQVFFDYHLYSLQRPTTVAQNQVKQVALMNVASIPVVKEYWLSGGRYFRRRYRGEIKLGVNVWLRFTNDKASNLGMPLPKGVVRIYKKDDKGKALFIGEDRIGHTPEGLAVRLRMGRAFDVTGSRKQTDYIRSGFDRRTYETAHQITLRNAKDKTVTVIIREPIPGDWRMIRASQAHTKFSSNLAEWRIKVPAKGKTVLTYRVRVQY
ncbi:MAG: DUF4139 domain-containing protein [Alphaproteobacteria bacterium]|nr:DUF4139 domain-containing protein [Alphaproteobacteria bacterium]